MKKNIFDLSGRSVLITGGGGLLGVAHAEALLDIGATIVLTDISDKELMAAAKTLRDSFPSGSIHTFMMDVTSESSIGETADEIVDLGSAG